VENGEDFFAALSRELREELGVEMDAARPLIKVRHAYADKAVLLDVWRVERYFNEPQGLEGQPLRWLAPEAMEAAEFPAADVPVINALRLPDQYLITGDAPDRETWLRFLEQALQRGIRLAQLRSPQFRGEERLELYREARALAHRYGATLLLNGSPEQVRAIDADGVHLTAGRLLECDNRPLPNAQWVAASCHNLAELQQAERIGVDFVVVSPVRATASHPDTVPMGWDGLRALTDAVNLPVFALGGMTSGDLEMAWEFGAQGVAGIRRWWDK
jgi:8-oxo-dGTP diphosphatase